MVGQDHKEDGAGDKTDIGLCPDNVPGTARKSLIWNRRQHFKDVLSGTALGWR